MAKIQREIDLSFALDNKIIGSQICLPIILLSKKETQILQEMAKSNKCATITVEAGTKKRSLLANKYAWKLCDLIAEKVGSDRDTIHNEMLLRYGVFDTISVKSEIVDKVVRNFDYYKMLGESELNNQKFTHIRVVLGSHKYNSKEMAKFIDGLILEAKALDIETLPPAEIKRMCENLNIKEC